VRANAARICHARQETSAPHALRLTLSPIRSGARPPRAVSRTTGVRPRSHAAISRPAEDDTGAFRRCAAYHRVWSARARDWGLLNW